MSKEAPLFNEPTEVTGEDGEVILDGPDGVDVKLTPKAARETSDRLLEGAAMAQGQKRLRNLPHQPRKSG